jgi:PIN domain-containing protein
VTDVVLDTGALVRFQRERRLLTALIAVAETDDLELVASATTLAEFLGASPRSARGAADWIASLLKPAAVDEVITRRAATLMRAARDAAPTASPGPIDALVAAEAERRAADVVIHGDRADFAALASASGRFRAIEIEDLIG